MSRIDAAGKSGHGKSSHTISLDHLFRHGADFFFVDRFYFFTADVDISLDHVSGSMGDQFAVDHAAAIHEQQPGLLALALDYCIGGKISVWLIAGYSGWVSAGSGKLRR